jgi:hypothetical protein
MNPGDSAPIEARKARRARVCSAFGATAPSNDPCVPGSGAAAFGGAFAVNPQTAQVQHIEPALGDIS